MFKLNTALLSLLIFILLSPFSVFAADESITITTYYPSPYGAYNELKTYSNTYLAISSGNVGVGTVSPGGGVTAGTRVLSLAAGTAPTGGVANQVSLYSSGGELYTLDSSGNATLLSPHDTISGEWIFYSMNTHTGRIVRVDMERMVKAIERLTGEKFMVEKWETLN
jgi:hypothetical protein